MSSVELEYSNLTAVPDLKLLSALSHLSSISSITSSGTITQSPRPHTKPISSLIESHKVSTYKNLLSSLESLSATAVGVEKQLISLRETAESLAQVLNKSKSNSKNLVEDITKLENERNNLVKERDLALAYQRAFQLTSSEIKELKGVGNGTLPPSFFKVFDKIGKIRKGVEVLMQIGHVSTGVEISEQMSLYEETGLERMYRWSQSHCRQIEVSEVSGILSSCVGYLECRPMLLKYVLDEYATHRRSLLVRFFIDALSGVGTRVGIELIGSSDPVRYLSDILAWIHQSLPTEKDNFTLLISSCTQIDKDDKMKHYLALIVDGLCQPLKIRMEQTLASPLPLLLLHQISNLLLFYIETLGEIIPGSNLISVLHEVHLLSSNTFNTELTNEIESQLGCIKIRGISTTNLSPPEPIHSLMGILKELLVPHPPHANNLIDGIMEPLLGKLEEAGGHLPSTDHAVFSINASIALIGHLKVVGELGEKHRRRLESEVEGCVDRLSSDQSSWLLAQLGIGHIYNLLHEKIKEPLSTVPGMDPSSLLIFINKLESVVSNPQSVLLIQLNYITDNETRKIIQKRSFKILGAIYRQIYDEVMDPKNAYPPNFLQLDPLKFDELLS